MLKSRKRHKAREEEEERLTNMTTIVGEVPTGVEMAASPEHVQLCVECGGWGGGWLMSQAHMLASVPDLLVSPVRHYTTRSCVCSWLLLCVVVCVRKR